MPRERNAFRLGLAGIVIIGLFFVVLLYIGGRGWGQNVQEITVRFAHDMGLPVLKEGSAVFCGASQVGQVERVWFAGDTPDSPTGPGEPLNVYVRFTVERKVDLRTDCHITAQGPLLGGSGSLAINNRGTSDQQATAKTIIQGRKPGSFGAIVDSLSRELDESRPGSLLATIKGQLDPTQAASLMAMIHESMRDINAVTARLSLEMNPQEKGVLIVKLHAILGNINEATSLLRNEMEPGKDAALMHDLHRAMDQVNEGLAEAVAMLKENREPVGNTVGEIEQMARTINQEVVAQLAAEFQPENEGSLLAGMHYAMNQVNASLDNLVVISNDAKDMIILNKYNVNSAMTNLKVASDYLKGGIRYLVAHPWLLFNPPQDKDSQERQAAQAAREFTEAANRLDDAMARLQAVLELKGEEVAPNDPQLIAAREQLENATEQFGKVESMLWKLAQ